MFKLLRSFVGKILPESLQMKIIIFLSDSFWLLRKYFLGAELDYPKEFINNWKSIKKKSSQDRERNFTLYQLINIHNEKFKNEETNIIEFGVSRGSSLKLISKFSKEKTNIFGIDSFGFYADEIKKRSTSRHDKNYHGPGVAFNTKTRFLNFSVEKLQNEINSDSNFYNKKLYLIKCHFPDVINDDDKKIVYDREYAFAYLDFDLHISTLRALEFILPRMKKNGIILIDDYNFINQEGCKVAVKEFGLNIDKCFQTQSGQLIYFN